MLDPFMTDREKLCLRMLGAIANPTHVLREEGQFFGFDVCPEAVQLVRELDTKEAEPKDIVAKVNDAVRKHPILAWLLIVLLTLTALATLVNQVIQLIKHIVG